MAVSVEAGRPVDVGLGETIADGPRCESRSRWQSNASAIRSTAGYASRARDRRGAGRMPRRRGRSEPSAAAAVAAARTLDAVGPVALIMTGRNLDPAILARASTDLESFLD